jgi:hypothetical protein
MPGAEGMTVRAMARQLSTRRDRSRTDREPLSGTAGNGRSR